MFSGISIWQLLILLAIVVLLFGTKKLRNMGGDLGGAIKGFKSAMKDGEEEQAKSEETDDPASISAEKSESTEATSKTGERQSS